MFFRFFTATAATGLLLCIAFCAGCAERRSPLEQVKQDAGERHEEFVKKNQKESEESRRRMERYMQESRVRSPDPRTP